MTSKDCPEGFAAAKRPKGFILATGLMGSNLWDGYHMWDDFAYVN